MKRDLAQLCDREYDLVVIGGGIYGACAAWDARQRGLSVALIERNDFCSATSAHSFKMIHGGIRYIQHGDVFRVRQSSNERRAFMRIAPHLVRPLPIAIPTYGHGMKGKEILRTGMALYDLVTFDRNRGINDPIRQIPNCRAMGRSEALERFPGLKRDGLTGGAVFCDGQLVNPPRLVLAIVRRASAEGAVVANYVEATGFSKDGNRVTGVKARDALTGDDLEIRSRMVLNAAGPHAERLLATGLGTPLEPQGTYSRDACFVVKRRIVDHAVAVQGATRDPDAVVGRGERHLFLVPWRDYTLVGVWHVVYPGDPDEFVVTDEEIQTWMDEMNAAYPAANLTLADVSTRNAGLVLFGENEPGAVNLRYGHRSRMVDHRARQGIDGLITLIGVRYTTGRTEAAKAVDLILQQMGRTAPPCRTDVAPVYGGEFEQFDSFVDDVRKREARLGLADDVIRHLVVCYGSAVTDVTRLIDDDPTLAEPVAQGKNVPIKAQIVYAAQSEMAQTLGDVLYRRTDLATGESAGQEIAEGCAELMARELGWSQERIDDEIRTLVEPISAGRSQRAV